jgi:hypothetical protein
MRVTMPPSNLSRLLVVAASLTPIASAAYFNSTKCRNIPGDDGWPALQEWSALNASVSGRLIKTTPAAHVCHDPTYNAEACEALNSTWIFPWAQ